MSNPITILPHADSDLTIPPVSAIIVRAGELHADAVRQSDLATARQLKNLIDALVSGMRMTWALGDLLVSSASTPGVVYTVSCGACNCPAYKPCKHLKLAEVLLDMFDTQAGDADLEADADDWAAACEPPIDIPDGYPDPTPGGPPPPSRAPWYARAATARSCYLVNWGS